MYCIALKLKNVLIQNIKKLAFDGFYPLLVVLKKIDFCCCLKKKKKNRFLLFQKKKYCYLTCNYTYMTDFDIIIAGDGPSGCLAAIHLKLHSTLTVCMVGDTPLKGKQNGVSA